MNAHQYILIFAVLIIAALGVFFVISSRHNSIVVENPNLAPIIITPAATTSPTITSTSSLSTATSTH